MIRGGGGQTTCTPSYPSANDPSEFKTGYGPTLCRLRRKKSCKGCQIKQEEVFEKKVGQESII